MRSKSKHITEKIAMMSYLLKKMGYYSLTLCVIITLTFFLMKALPGDPFTEERTLPEEIRANLMRHYGLDQPLYIQYFKYLQSIAIWDLGPSFKYKTRTVNSIIWEGFSVSAVIGGIAICISVGFGMILGTVAALWKNRWQDHTALLFTVVGISMPSFILATVLQYIFAVQFPLLPIARWETWSHTILPIIALCALPTAFIARLTRANMVEVLEQDYIKAAKAKGMSTPSIVLYHALRNAVMPVIAYLGQMTVNILTGSFIIERIFGIPGLGQWFVTSVSNRDYTVIMGTTLFYGILMISMTFFVDIIYGFLDPRIRKEHSS